MKGKATMVALDQFVGSGFVGRNLGGGVVVACVAMLWSFAARAENGRSFTLVATEENTKDMSVNLVSDTLRDDRLDENGVYQPVLFGDRSIYAPAMAISKEEAINLVNHDSGILDIQHTFLTGAPLASRILISFETLKQELRKNCWQAQDAPNLRATLRMRLIPPFGPDKHNRLLGISPSTFFSPSVDIDPPPARAPIAVFEQQKPWIEGDGQNSFFTATYDEAHLLDVSTVGVSKAGTQWEGLPLEGVDLCLNRAPGQVAVGRNNNRAELCYNPDPNWEPWMEWDVTRAVQKWMREGFNPATYHGFSLYQYPGETVKDQVRISPEEHAKARTRAVLSFASSSGKADCPSVGGLFGGPSQAEIVFGNMKCMTADPHDTVMTVLKPGGKAKPIPRILEMKTHPDWAPQLVIEAVGPSRSCAAQIDFLPERPDLSTQGPAPLDMKFGPLRAEDSIQVRAVQVQSSPGVRTEVIQAGCAPGVVVPGGSFCSQRLAVTADAVGLGKVAVKVHYSLNGETGPWRSMVQIKEVSISEDFDGTPDAVENLVPRQDANQDGIPDRSQSHVNSVQDPRGGWLSLSTRPGLKIDEVGFPELKPDRSQGAVEYKRGFIGFRVRDLPVGGPAKVQIQAQLPFEEHSSFWGFGPTPDDFQPHWFHFEDKGSYGAKLDQGRMELLLHDGAIGDIDGIANGEIVVAGAVGLKVGASQKNPTLTDATVANTDLWLWIFLGGFGAALALWERRCDQA